MRASVICVIVLVAPIIGGCLTGAETSDPWVVCETGYYVGCDENPDAIRLKEEFGLLQITNTSERIGSARPRLTDGVASWYEGGFGRPVTLHAFSIEDERHARLGPFARGVHGEFPGPSRIVYTQTAIPTEGEETDYSTSRIMVWEIKSNTTTPMAGKPEGPFISTLLFDSLDWPWFLLIERQDAESKNGLIAFNLETRDWLRLEDVAPTDSTRYGGALLSYVVSGGSAFLGYSFERNGTIESELVEVDLETGQRFTRDAWTGSYLLHVRGGENYVVYDRPWEGEGRVVAYDRPADRVVALDVDKDSAEWVRVGKEWIVYSREETGPNPLVAHHIATGQERIVLRGNTDFGAAEWDIDEPWVAIKSAPDYFTRLEYEQPQIYLYEMSE